ncbi:short-chain dehydrogenase [Ornithinibacillus halotolerans]|nr:short-chain dehydrogenase [Ornithinibacillus halotolerans]
MKHALVVGGTGMLQEVSLWLVRNGYHVSIIARNRERMEHLIEKAESESQITPLLVNYHNDHALQEIVKKTIKENGKIDVVLTWIHSNAKKALPIIMHEVANRSSKWELFHILGSSSNIDKIRRTVKPPENCLYYQIQLGFIIEGNHSRWLTHQEISNGVIGAICTKQNVYTVGQLEPWEQRP